MIQTITHLLYGQKKKKKNSIPIRIDYTEDLHSCAAERTAADYKTKDCHTFKDSWFLVFCCVGAHFIQIIADLEHQVQDYTLP